jgi:RNA polymerase sigma-70 factor (ECF subfamily)
MVLTIETEQTVRKARSSRGEAVEETRMATDTTEREERTAEFHCELDRAASDYGKGADREKNLGLITSRCQVDLERYFASRKVPQSDAEDLVQETLITVAETLDGFRGDACVRTWVTKIAEHNLYRRWNRRKKSSQIESNEDLPVEPETSALSPEDEVASRELSALVRDEVRKLPPRMRACLELRLYQDRSYKEIADILGMKIGTVGVTLKHAEERLKKALGKRILVNKKDFEDRT